MCSECDNMELCYIAGMVCKCEGNSDTYLMVENFSLSTMKMPKLLKDSFTRMFSDLLNAVNGLGEYVASTKTAQECTSVYYKSDMGVESWMYDKNHFCNCSHPCVQNCSNHGRRKWHKLD